VPWPRKYCVQQWRVCVCVCVCVCAHVCALATQILWHACVRVYLRVCVNHRPTHPPFICTHKQTHTCASASRFPRSCEFTSSPSAWGCGQHVHECVGGTLMSVLAARSRVCWQHVHECVGSTLTNVCGTQRSSGTATWAATRTTAPPWPSTWHLRPA